IIAKTTDIVCKTNDKFVEGTKCYVQTLSWDKSIGQMDCFLKKPLKNPTINMQFMKRDKFQKYQPFLANFSVSLCDIISKNKLMSYGSGLWETLRKYTNANHSCPFSGHLYARNISIDAVYVPSAIPNGAFLLIFNFIEPFPKGIKESYGTVKWYYEIMQKKEKNPKTRKG
ncbi:hypothetical protein KR032_001205, partial [Drosophila birchii]